MLHTPIYDVRGMPYCGPTAIAAVTGEPISHYTGCDPDTDRHQEEWPRHAGDRREPTR